MASDQSNLVDEELHVVEDSESRLVYSYNVPGKIIPKRYDRGFAIAYLIMFIAIFIPAFLFLEPIWFLGCVPPAILFVSHLIPVPVLTTDSRTVVVDKTTGLLTETRNLHFLRRNNAISTTTTTTTRTLATLQRIKIKSFKDFYCVHARGLVLYYGGNDTATRVFEMVSRRLM